MIRPHVEVLHRPDLRLELTSGELEIGRAALAEIGVEAAAVSRRHASIVGSGHGYHVTDHASTNGTHLNGDAVDGSVPLRDGDHLVVGGAVTLVFRDPMATPLAPAIGRLTGVWIDGNSSAVWVDATLVDPPLSRRQVDLLRLLLEHEDEFVPNHRVVDTVWADVAADGVSAEAVDALVKRVRQRLRDTGLGRDLIERRRGLGIRLRSDS